MADLALAANMSPATFHRQFKSVTGMTPLQYQKQLRLHEARRLMIFSDAMVDLLRSTWAMRASRSLVVNTPACSEPRLAVMSPLGDVLDLSREVRTGGSISTGVSGSTPVVCLALCADIGAIAIRPCPSANVSRQVPALTLLDDWQGIVRMSL